MKSNPDKSHPAAIGESPPDAPPDAGPDLSPTAANDASADAQLDGRQEAAFDADRMLLDYVRERDVECPKCAYNLRNLTRPLCPECREPLHLTVGLEKPRFGLFVAAIIPGAFSGICALILLMPIILVPAAGSGPPAPIGIILLDSFGWLSGFVAIGLFVLRHRFLRLSRPSQIAWATSMWLIHLAAFATVLAIAI